MYPVEPRQFVRFHACDSLASASVRGEGETQSRNLVELQEDSASIMLQKRIDYKN